VIDLEAGEMIYASEIERMEWLGEPRTFKLPDGTYQHVINTERPDLKDWPEEIEP